MECAVRVHRDAALRIFRARFDRKSHLAERLEQSNDETLSDEFDRIEEATASPALELVEGEGKRQPFGLLYIDGARAGFRLL